MLFILDKSTHEENLSQLIQINSKRFKKSVTFYDGI